MSYEPYEALIAPARAKASLLRLILGLVITALLYMLLVSLSWQVLLSVMGEAWFEQTLQLPGPSSPSQMFVILGSFVFMTAAVSFTVWSLHHHSPLLLIGEFARAKGQFFRTIGSLFVMATVVAVIASYGTTFVQKPPAQPMARPAAPHIGVPAHSGQCGRIGISRIFTKPIGSAWPASIFLDHDPFGNFWPFAL
jgi:hypothetical protein